MTILVGALLIVVGLAGYFLTDRVSPTALIPAAFGIALMMLGAYGQQEGRRRTAMHLAMGVALVGIIGTFGGLLEVARGLSADTGTPLGPAAIAKAIMAGTLIVYLILGIQTFISARRRG